METVITEQKKITIKKWDSIKYIKTKENVIAELESVFEEDGADFLLPVMGDIVRSEGFLQIARNLGLTREGLRQAIAPAGEITIGSAIKLLDLAGFRFRLEPKIA